MCLLVGTGCRPSEPSSVKDKPTVPVVQPIDSVTQDFHTRANQLHYHREQIVLMQRNKLRQDSVLLMHGNDARYEECTDFGAMAIGHLFGDRRRFAVLTWQTDESTLENLVLEQRENDWDTLVNYTCEARYDGELPPYERIVLEDYNGDGVPDLYIINYYGDIHTCLAGNLWIYKKGMFRFIHGFDNIPNPVYDPGTGHVCGYVTDGCADMYMEMSEYIFKGDSVMEKDAFELDCCEVGTSGECVFIRGDREEHVSVRNVCRKIPRLYRDGVWNKISGESRSNGRLRR